MAHRGKHARQDLRAGEAENPQGNAGRWFCASGISMALFCAFTTCLLFVDVQYAGPLNSTVGLATFNIFAFRAAGAGESSLAGLFDKASDAALAFAVLLAAVLVIWSLVQLVKRRSVSRVSADLRSFWLVAVLLVAAYLGFDFLALNSRPVLVDGVLEPSYPSSHVLAVTAVCGCFAFAFWDVMEERPALRVVALVFLALVCIVVVAGRLASGMHWATDVIGALLLALAIVFFYRGFSIVLSR